MHIPETFQSTSALVPDVVPDDRWLDGVGSNIQFQRVRSGLTQEKLAERADLAPRTIQKIEAGSITILITTLRRIRNSLGCSYEDLLVGNERIAVLGTIKPLDLPKHTLHDLRHDLRHDKKQAC